MAVNIPNVVVIDSKHTCAFQSLLDIEGFHFLAGPHSNPKDPTEAIQQPSSSKKNIEENIAEKYGGPYKNITSMRPLKTHINWSERQVKDADTVD
ncbi:uncharacterized protein N7482_010145 [Penicillium canariense]|uniref:Uncharacterized protein n=1 Tax=Penicillium canariense TaxID=189055 RepID=A0A9W9LE20_9EURO|nr:uncharacterized protein N7482_010145 [Penicillium canariense]KAJ5150893.1 hypothetical protein N7482_010145 [Penicillium canariense]